MEDMESPRIVADALRDIPWDGELVTELLNGVSPTRVVDTGNR
jgi:hypothetical protein